MASKNRVIIWFTLGILALTFSLVYSNFIQDDAYITYRYARNISTGVGFVYNPGEAVLGTTTPLYTSLLAFFSFLTHLSVVQISKILNFLSLWIGAGFLYEIGRKGGMAIAIVTSLLYITHPLLRYSVGMESQFLVCLLIVTVFTYSKRKWSLTAILLGLLIVTRYETMLFAILLLVHSYVGWRQRPYWITPAIAIVACWLIYSFIAFGALIPLSVSAKLVAIKIPFLLGGAVYWTAFVGETAYYNLFLFFFLVGFVFLIIRRSIDEGFFLVLCWSAIYLLAASFFAGSFPWYYVPLIPGFAIIVAYGIRSIAQIPIFQGRHRSTQDGNRSQVILGVIAGSLLCIHSFFWINDWKIFQGSAFDHRFTPYQQVSDWLNDHAMKEQSLATREIGYLGYFTDMKIIDLFGLVTPGIFPWVNEGPEATLFHTLEIYTPDYVLIDPSVIQEDILAGDSCYQLVQEFEQGYRLYQRDPAGQTPGCQIVE
ncbi:MAG: hypothetical protein MUO58_03785 [Anaerolineales bacterium]|nr:hypothetical protein [Anaerolineales bacterium]